MGMCQYIVGTRQKIKKKKVHIVSTRLVLLSFHLGSPILFHFIFFLVFLTKHFWIFTKPTAMRNYTHFCKFYSEEDKHLAVNCLSIGEAGLYSKEHTKKKVAGR